MELSRTVRIACPYCGELIEMLVELAARRQDYIEDCSVCCKPMQVHIFVDADGELHVDAHSDDE
jgi:hypothetical protein